MVDTSLKVELSHLRPWSFSKVQKARKCQYEFYFRYVAKAEPLEKPDFFILGSGVHFVLENALLRALRDGKPLSRSNLLDFARAFKESEPKADLDRISHFFPNILKFVNGQIKRIGKGAFFEPEIELAVDSSFNLSSYFSGGVFLRGKLDLVFEKDGFLYIVDHKTSRSTDFDNRVKTQLRWYALLARVRFPRFERFALELHNVRYGTIRRVIFTAREIEAFRKRLLPLIEEVEREFLGRDFSLLTPSPGEQCRWCEYRHLCPAAPDSL
jgi:putative RecB family exonuclease